VQSLLDKLQPDSIMSGAAFDLISSHEKNTTALKLCVLYCNGMVGNPLGVILDGHVWSLLMIWLSFASDLSSQRAITEP